MIEGGASIHAVVDSAAGWLPRHDRPFVLAAAGSGRLPLVLNNLADRHEQLGATQRRVFMACLYPAFIFHFAVLVFSLLRIISSEKGLQGLSVGNLLGGALMILVPIWGGVALLAYLVRQENRLASAFLDLLPAIGGYRKNQALADFAFALGNLLEAGAPIGRAWVESGRIARSRSILAASQTTGLQIEQGLAPGAQLSRHPVFPSDFVARYCTGEVTGSLEHALIKLAADYQERANQRLHAATLLYPGLLFASVALMVAYIVIRSVMGYVGTLNQLMDGR